MTPAGKTNFSSPETLRASDAADIDIDKFRETIVTPLRPNTRGVSEMLVDEAYSR